MANDTSRKPWALDTAAVITADRIRVRGLRWVGSGVAGDNCQVEDANGERVWEALSEGANIDIVDNFGDRGRDFQGFEVAAIDGGILYVDLA